MFPCPPLHVTVWLIIHSNKYIIFSFLKYQWPHSEANYKSKINDKQDEQYIIQKYIPICPNNQPPLSVLYAVSKQLTVTSYPGTIVLTSRRHEATEMTRLCFCIFYRMFSFIYDTKNNIFCTWPSQTKHFKLVDEAPLSECSPYKGQFNANIAWLIRWQMFEWCDISVRKELKVVVIPSVTSRHRPDMSWNVLMMLMK